MTMLDDTTANSMMAEALKAIEATNAESSDDWYAAAYQIYAAWANLAPASFPSELAESGAARMTRVLRITSIDEGFNKLVEAATPRSYSALPPIERTAAAILAANHSGIGTPSDVCWYTVADQIYKAWTAIDPARFPEARSQEATAAMGDLMDETDACCEVIAWETCGNDLLDAAQAQETTPGMR